MKLSDRYTLVFIGALISIDLLEISKGLDPLTVTQLGVAKCVLAALLANLTLLGGMLSSSIHKNAQTPLTVRLKDCGPTFFGSLLAAGILMREGAASFLWAGAVFVAVAGFIALTKTSRLRDHLR